MKTVWSEHDEPSVASKHAKRSIWAQDFATDMDAMKAFVAQAQRCAEHFEEASVAQEHFDNQLSQFVRRYILKQEYICRSKEREYELAEAQRDEDRENEYFDQL